MKNVIFSIGIPAYKAKFINECIDSILAQTIYDFELIIVNDASPEPLDEIISLYTDSRIRYYKNEQNFGAEHVVDNWNKCLSYAKGEYFVLMGDDDKMEPNFLEEFQGLISKYPDLDVYHSRSFIIDEKSNKNGLTQSWPEYESVYENIWHRMNSYRMQFISDFVYRTNTLNRNNGFYKLPLAWTSDDISSYIAIGKKGIAHTNKPVFNYRRNAQTISSTGSERLKMCAIILEKEWFNVFLCQQTTSFVDEIFKQNIRLGLNKYIQKKKIYTISQSYEKGLLSQFSYWFLKRDCFDIKIAEIIYSVFEYFKRKRSLNEY